MTTFATKKGMTLRRFGHAMRFTCVRCDLLKTSKFRAETPDGVICNGCYGKRLAGVPIVKVPLDEPALHGTKTGRSSTIGGGAITLCPHKNFHFDPEACAKETKCESG